MIKALALAAMMAFTPAAATELMTNPVTTPTQTAEECITPEYVFSELAKLPEIDKRDLVLDSEDDINEIKEFIHVTHGVPIEDLTFDRLDVYTFSEYGATFFPDQVWVVLFQEGCLASAFPESIVTLETIKEIVQ